MNLDPPQYHGVPTSSIYCMFQPKVSLRWQSTECASLQRLTDPFQDQES